MTNDWDLDSLLIRDFRSIRGQITVPLGAQVVLIHGTNGTGKTTVLSALELGLTGELAEVPPKDREYLVHRGRSEATVELRTRGQTVTHSIEAATVDGRALLQDDQVKFFQERCYLTQATLGRLLEIYQEPVGYGDSPLTRFVKDLLGLDELEALIEGLDCVRDRRLVKRLSDSYSETVSRLDREREHSNRVVRDLRVARAARRDAREALARTTAEKPAPSGVALANEIAVEGWLELHSDDEVGAAKLVGQRRELMSLAGRWKQLSDACGPGREIADAETTESSARGHVDEWWRGPGQKLDALLDDLRSTFPSLASARAVGPRSSFRAAAAFVLEDLERRRRELSADDELQAVAAGTREALDKNRARVTTIDEQLAELVPPTDLEQLAHVLAALAPHLAGEECPVCGRDYSEISSEPLSARLAARISELTTLASQLQDLTKARVKAVNAARQAESSLAEYDAGKLAEAHQLQLRTELASLEGAHQKLLALEDLVNEGAALIERHVAAQTRLARARDDARAVTELRSTADELSTSMGRKLEESEPLGDGLERLIVATGEELAAIEARRQKRDEVSDGLATLRALTAQAADQESRAEEHRKVVADLQAAVGRIESRRQVFRGVRRDAIEARGKITREVFSTSLNAVWRDLFIRLAPSEPFVPAFRLPASDAEGVTAHLETVHRDGHPAGSPQAMLSAGNLNTAALTLFLALHLSAPQKLPWLVLDDPVQSMDELHVSQFAALLRTLAHQHGRRLIIAVHERQLFEYLALEMTPAAPEQSLITVDLSSNLDGDTLATTAFVTYAADAVESAA